MQEALQTTVAQENNTAISTIVEKPVVAEVATVDATKVETKEDLQQKVAPKFAALAKKEKMIYQKNQAVKQREMELERKTQLLATKEKAIQLAETDPEQAMKLLGWTYDQLTEYKLKGKAPVDRSVLQVKEDLERFQKQVEEKERKQLEDQAKQAQTEQQQTINDFKLQVVNFVSEKKDDYELTNLFGEQALVYTAIEEHFKSTGKILKQNEAAKVVEDYLEDMLNQGMKTKKFMAKRQVLEKPAEKPREVRESKTLTNDLVTTVGPGSLPAKTEEDRIKRALAALEGSKT